LRSRTPDRKRRSSCDCTAACSVPCGRWDARGLWPTVGAVGRTIGWITKQQRHTHEWNAFAKRCKCVYSKEAKKGFLGGNRVEPQGLGSVGVRCLRRPRSPGGTGGRGLALGRPVSSPGDGSALRLRARGRGGGGGASRGARSPAAGPSRGRRQPNPPMRASMVDIATENIVEYSAIVRTLGQKNYSLFLFFASHSFCLSHPNGRFPAPIYLEFLTPRHSRL